MEGRDHLRETLLLLIILEGRLPPCWTFWTRNSNLATANGQTGRHLNGGGEAVESRKRRGVLFRSQLCMERGMRTSPLTRDYAAPCRGCLLLTYDPYDYAAEEAPGASPAMATSARRGRGGDSHKSEQYFLSFAASDMYCHLHNVDA